MNEMTEAIQKVADSINKKRREELIETFNDRDLLQELHRTRLSGEFDTGNKSKTMRKVASIPVEVDHFFQKIYGPDYYKDKDFFDKFAPEWKVTNKT